MDKNIAAFLREDAYSVTVSFQYSENTSGYRYVTTISGLKVGDMVIVPYNAKSLKQQGERLSVAIVLEVFDDLTTPPNADMQEKWVHSKIDHDYYSKLMADNEILQTALATAYRSNLKRSYAAQMLAGVDEATRLTLDSVLSPKESK